MSLLFNWYKNIELSPSSHRTKAVKITKRFLYKISKTNSSQRMTSLTCVAFVIHQQLQTDLRVSGGCGSGEMRWIRKRFLFFDKKETN